MMIVKAKYMYKDNLNTTTYRTSKSSSPTTEFMTYYYKYNVHQLLKNYSECKANDAVICEKIFSEGPVPLYYMQ